MLGLLTRILPGDVPRADSIALDRIVAFATITTAIVTSFLFGVIPALQASQTNAHVALKGGGDRGSTSGGHAFGRSALVVAEVALTLVLLAGAGLLLNSLLRLQRVDSGMRPEHATVVALVLPQSRYPTAASQTAVYRRVIDGIATRPGVQAVGVGFPGPLRGSNASGSFTIENRDASNPADRPFANLGSVSGGYFAAMGIPLVAGRTFRDADSAEAPPVAIASAAMARKYWPGQDPIGKRLRFDDDAKTPWSTIVGVVGDVRQLGLQQDPPPILYMPYQQFPLPFTNVSVRSSPPAGDVAALVRAQLERHRFDSAAWRHGHAPGPHRHVHRAAALPDDARRCLCDDSAAPRRRRRLWIDQLLGGAEDPRDRHSRCARRAAATGARADHAGRA